MKISLFDRGVISPYTYRYSVYRHRLFGLYGEEIYQTDNLDDALFVFDGIVLPKTLKEKYI